MPYINSNNLYSYEKRDFGPAALWNTNRNSFKNGILSITAIRYSAYGIYNERRFWTDENPRLRRNPPIIFLLHFMLL